MEFDGRFKAIQQTGHIRVQKVTAERSGICRSFDIDLEPTENFRSRLRNEKWIDLQREISELIKMDLDDIPWLEQLNQARSNRAVLGMLLISQRVTLIRIAHHLIPLGLKSKANSADLVQETFLEAQRDFDQFHGTCEREWTAWLVRLLRNNITNFVRKYHSAKRRAARELSISTIDNPMILSAEETSVSEGISQEERLNTIQNAMRFIHPRYQRVIQLRWQGISVEEIAQEFGCSVKAVRMSWKRAIEQLKQVIHGDRKHLSGLNEEALATLNGSSSRTLPR
jgi:RNA polymerase sigma-70 factor, ECF subfamily